jgi:peptidoglycan/LPS O-acetylase OafA/YrhL
MLSLIAFLLFPLVAFLVRRRRGVRALVVVMIVAAIVTDSDAQFHILTALGSAGYDSKTIWVEATGTTLAYLWFPESSGQRLLQFVGTVLLCLFIAWTVGGVWV